MGDGREQVSLQARDHQQNQQRARDNSTESEEPPSNPPPPPPQPSGSGGGGSGGGCTQESHAGKEVLNTAVQLPIEMVFNLLFLHEQFMLDVYGMKKTYDVAFTPWEDQEDGHRARQTTYTMTLPSSNLGPKVSYVTEKQVILSQSKAGEAYVVELEASNTGIPYADAFVVASHYCFTKEEANKTRVRVWVTIKYKKTLWGLVKTMIEKNTYSGVEGLLAEVVTQLGTEADRLANPKINNRRRKRISTDKTGGSRHAVSNTRGKTADKGEGTNSLAVVVVMVALLVLASSNVVLYLRLSQLEQQSTPGDSSTPVNRYITVTGSWEAVARLLQRQQEMHQHQLEEWRARLQQAAGLLQEVQESVEAVVRSIPEHEEALRNVMELQSADVLAGWLQAEESLKKQINRIKSDEGLGNTAQGDPDAEITRDT